MTPCEKCGAARPADGQGGHCLHDYCAKCAKNLCDDCMAKGCCGVVPAESGASEEDTYVKCVGCGKWTGCVGADGKTCWSCERKARKAEKQEAT